jgi:hypothetical protein
LNTLKRIANVFDVALIVRFAPFSRLFATIDNETFETLAVPSFVDEFGTESAPIITPHAKVIDLEDRLRKMVGIGDKHQLGQDADSAPTTPLGSPHNAAPNRFFETR